DGEGTGPPHRVRLARAIFIRCIKAVVLQVQRQPRRVGADQRLQGAWLDLTAFRIEAQTQDAWTAAVMGVTTDQNLWHGESGSRAAEGQGRGERHAVEQAARAHAGSPRRSCRL